ncbi:MAG: DEAD/DEAH box helicase family protein [Thaumarchaeota archaeon]|nr:DEAD/DEAH box helicase family protein [Nitrososphaerota archaeon]
MQPTYLSYDKGTLLIRSDAKVPYSTWDTRVRAFRAQSLYYREILEFLTRSELSAIKDGVEDLPPCPELKSRTVAMRGYQKRALDAWDKAGRRGVIVLPTGAGKTVIAMKAIELVNKPAIVVVPTLDLLEQWRKRIEEEMGTEVGVYGGGENTVRAVTICTYDSAFIRAGELGNRFSFLIFDEVHHLPGESFRQIAEMFTAPYRMGLTATYEREDMLHLEVPRLIGGVVYRLKSEDLAGRYLSDFRLEKVNVELTQDEKIEYERNYKMFTRYLDENRIWLNTPIAFQRFIMRSSRDPQARQALLARNRALSIAFNSEAKLDRLEEILRSNPDERVLIFTQHNDLAYKIARRFLVPFITHNTGKEERFDVLKDFREGSYRAIVTSKVLDEGIDVPEASVGVIVSGTGSSREFIQRLGRLLRKSEGKGQARLIELVSKDTSETRTSNRRTKSKEGKNDREKKKGQAGEQDPSVPDDAQEITNEFLDEGEDSVE